MRASSCTNRTALDDKLSPIPKEKIASVRSLTEERQKEFEKIGLQEVAEGRVAVLLMAGGQGTRLSVTYPKGMYNVGLPSGKSLFQLQAEKILCLQRLAEKECRKKGKIIWYILTSEATHDATLLLSKVQGILDDMVRRGIQSVHAHSVDNILIKVADPIFLGYCLSCRTDCGVKVVQKSSPSEPVGVVCQVDGCYQVVEYSEITANTAELCDNDGRLIYNAANICNHYFTTNFLCKIGDFHEQELDLHVAKKKIPYIDEEGVRHLPKVANGIKIEKFVFDVFKFAKSFAVWEGDREEEFSPLKNADSAKQDCPSTVRSDMLRMHKKWLLAAGAKSVIGDVEISPLLSYAEDMLRYITR
ncbi:hypothetical protein KM043_017555 [Ampulex compressa]|nr:hypothetical protein KM043_017555 [Ampulex compressa]